MKTEQQFPITVVKFDLDPNLPDSLREELVSAFLPQYKLLQDMEAEYESIVNADITVFSPKTAKKAEELRRKYVTWRGTKGLKAIYEDKKAHYRIVGQSIDALERIGRTAAMEREDKLREIEEFQEREEARRIAELHTSRTESISMYIIDSTAPELAVLGEMTEDAWEKTFDKFRKLWNEEQERIAMQKIRSERISATSKYELYIENYEAILWEKLTEKAFNKILQDGISAHENQLAEAAMMQKERELEEIRVQAILKEQREKAEAAALAEKQAQDELNAIQKKLEEERLAQEQAAALAQANARAEQQKLIQLRIDAENREKAAQKALEDSILEQKRLAQEKLDEEQRLRDAEETRKLLLLQGSDADKIKELANAFESIAIPVCVSEQGIKVVSSFAALKAKWLEGLRRVASEMEDKF